MYITLRVKYLSYGRKLTSDLLLSLLENNTLIIKLANYFCQGNSLEWKPKYIIFFKEGLN